MFIEGYIQLGGGVLQYLRIGNGSKLLMAFHGYGNEAGMFAPFEPYLPGYTIISVNLPHHGKSEWHDDQPLQQKELTDLAHILMKEAGVNNISLAGYSIGAKLCLCIMEQMPAQVEQVLLIAPDGLVPNPLYSLVTRNVAGKWLFKDFLTKPQRYLPLINGLQKINLIDKARYKFAMHYIGSESDRKFLLRVWPSLRLIIPDRNKLRRVINEYKIPVHIFIGNRDKIILAAYGERFSRGMATVQLHIVDGKHWIFDEETIIKMAKSLLT